MQPADTPDVEAAIQNALANESTTELRIEWHGLNPHLPPLTVNDAQRIIACLLENPQLDTLTIYHYDIRDPAVLNVFRNGLPLCTSVTTVDLQRLNLGNEGLECLLPAFYNTSVTTLTLRENEIEGQRGGEVLRDLLVGNNSVVELLLWGSPIDPEVSIGLGQGLADNNHLEILNLTGCHIGNDFLANFLLPIDGRINNSLVHLNLSWNRIEGADGGRQVTMLLQCFTSLKVLLLNDNPLGPLGARALVPSLAAAASRLGELQLYLCGLGNDGVTNLIPQGQVNRSLTLLRLDDNNIEGADGGRQVTLLLQRFTALKVLLLNYNGNLGPLGARALAPGLAAASHLESLELGGCGLGNDGVANLLPDGEVNTSLTTLNLRQNNIEDLVGGENAVALAARCTNLDGLEFFSSVTPHYFGSNTPLSSDQQRRLDMLLERKRLCTEASALGGSTFPILFRAVEEAHHHEHGLSAIFVILQNDGDDYFCTALNRAIK